MTRSADSPLSDATASESPLSDGGQLTEVKPLQQMGLSALDWERHRETITRLYIDHRRPLKEVVSIMTKEHNFIATARMYKSRIAQWNLKKNFKSHEMKALVRRIQNNESAGKEATVAFNMYGKTVPRSKVEKFARRHKKDLGRLRSANAISSENSSLSPHSLSQNYTLLSIVEEDVESDQPSANYENEKITSLEPADSTLRLSSAFPPLLPRPPLAETPAGSPGQAVQDLLFTDQVMDDSSRQGAVFDEWYSWENVAPPPTPPLRSRTLHTVMQTDILQHSLLLALILSAMAKSIAFGDLSVARLDVLEHEASFDTEVLKTIVDLIAWLQLDRGVILLGVVYLCRFDSSRTFRHSRDIWLQLIVALKFAQIYTNDEPYSQEVWNTALRGLSKNPSEQGYLEGKVLSDEFISLHVQAGQWKILESRLCHISTTLLVWLDEGKLTSETARGLIMSRFEMDRC